MKVLVSVRLDSELLGWADGYARRMSTPDKPITRTAVVEGGIRALRDLAGGGVPDLESEPQPAVDSRQARVNALRGVR